MIYPSIHYYCTTLTRRFEQVTAERKTQLDKIALYIAAKLQQNLPVTLVYICTHNSRRSHFAQVWSNVAAAYYKVQNVKIFSGGTVATEFNTNAVKALNRSGFKIAPLSKKTNPLYEVRFDDTLPAIKCFSKKFDHEENHAL